MQRQSVIKCPNWLIARFRWLTRTYIRRRLSGPIRFIVSDVGIGNPSQLCYSAMFVSKDGIPHALRSHWIGFHWRDGCVRNTRCNFYPKSGKMKYCVEVILRWGCAQLVGIIWPSYYAVPTCPTCMSRVNTLSGCTIHVKIWILLMCADADVRI